MIERSRYLAALQHSIGTPLVKVLTGIRRCGKSTILSLFQDSLQAQGQQERRILKVNMESLEFDHLRDYRSMYAFVKERLPDGGIFLLDEAQEVEGWERLAASLLAEGRIECFVTGSNASLLSSDLAGLLTGRYQEIPIHPLSLTEYRLFSKVNDTEKTDDILARYLRFGGFPALHLLGSDDASAISYLGTLLDGILMRDVVQRHAIRDPEGLRRILAFAFDNIGSLTASRRISDYLKSQRRSISTDTVANYLAFLCDAFVLYKVRRYDIKGRQHLEYAEKYYAGDLGLRHGLLGYREQDLAGIVENAVFLELLRRGTTISTGSIGTTEVDFIAEGPSGRRYYQVAVALEQESTINREFGSLEAIDDHWPKAVIVMAPSPVTGRNGIRLIQLQDFLGGEG
jgi:hypothetical protein